MTTSLFDQLLVALIFLFPLFLSCISTRLRLAVIQRRKGIVRLIFKKKFRFTWYISKGFLFYFFY